MWSRPQGYYSGWHGKWKHDGGVIAQQGIHYIDLLCYLFGKPIKAISTISNVSNKLQAEDTHIGMIKFKDVTCTIGLSTALRPSDFKASIDIICQNKILSLSGIACNKVEILEFGNNKNKKLIKDCKKNSQKLKAGLVFLIINVSIKLLKATLIKVKPLRAIDTIETLKLINMLYLSSYKNKWVFNNKKLFLQN